MEIAGNLGISRFKLHQAAEIISAGGVIAYPTEAVFGLGCDPDSLQGLVRILEMKHRDESAGLILIASDRAQLEPWIDPFPEEEQSLASSPRNAVTWVVTARPGTPHWISGGRTTVAVRISQHPIATALCRLAKRPLISTSANRHGRPPARSRLAVRKQFGDGIDYIVPGPLGGNLRPTEIRVARTGAVLRPA